MVQRYSFYFFSRKKAGNLLGTPIPPVGHCAKGDNIYESTTYSGTVCLLLFIIMLEHIDYEKKFLFHMFHYYFEVSEQSFFHMFHSYLEVSEHSHFPLSFYATYGTIYIRAGVPRTPGTVFQSSLIALLITGAQHLMI